MGIYLLDYLKSIVWAIEVYVVSLFHRHYSTDVLTVCSNHMHSRGMNVQFTRALSKQHDMPHLRQKIIDRMELFNVVKVLEEVQQLRRITDHNRDSKLVLQNVKLCLHSILYVNTVYDRILHLSHTAFDRHQDHHEALLEKLWTALKPHERVGCWTEIGFQGPDPSSDFRGMGLLGLTQLVYFCSKGEGKRARDILLDSNHPRRFYPFAATGINFSAFIVELIHERRLDERIFRRLESVEVEFAVDVEGGPAANQKLVEIGMLEVHEAYCEVFSAFSDTWVAADPPNIMSFPAIFGGLKERFRGKYPRAVE